MKLHQVLTFQLVLHFKKYVPKYRVSVELGICESKRKFK